MIPDGGGSVGRTAEADELAGGSSRSSATGRGSPEDAMPWRPVHSSPRLVPFVLIGLCTVLEGASLLADVLLPPEIATGVLYAAIVLLGLWLPSLASILLLAGVTTAVAVIGYAMSPGPSLPAGWPVLANRGLTILGIWLVALLAARHHASTRALRRGEASLRAREARLRAILATAPEAIVVIDAHGLVESFSPAAEALFGYSAQEVVGRNVRLLMPSPDREAHDGYLARYLRTGERRVIGIGRVVKGRRKDGSVFPLELAVGEIVPNGCGRCFVGFIRDLTAKERMERELLQAQKMEAVGQLTGGIAHDFNNLLTVIVGNLEMLEERLNEKDDLVLLREAQNAVQSGAELTDRLLAFARRQPLDPRPVDPRRQVDEVAALLRRTLGETIEVRTVVPHDVPCALVDPGQLQNAILNLALNARDAMPKGGVLVLEVAAVDVDAADAQAHGELRPGSYVTLAVTDTGTGMPAEVRERAFEPFFTTKEAGAGTGLGLSMVYGFAKQSGGQAQIYSEPGHGTIVRLYLPRAPERQAADPAPRRISPLVFRAKGEAVLVAEDDPRVRRVSAVRLKELGYRVIEAEDGPQALRILAEDPRVDLLFTDMVMPNGMTGVDLAHRARERMPELKVVYTSGYAEPNLLQQGMAEGSVWLRKPYTALDLARTLRAVLDDGPAPAAGA